MNADHFLEDVLVDKGLVMVFRLRNGWYEFLALLEGEPQPPFIRYTLPPNLANPTVLVDWLQRANFTRLPMFIEEGAVHFYPHTVRLEEGEFYV